jgi:hypothetical protein
VSAPTRAVRAAVYERDGNRCVVCGATSPLTFQHRRAEGMGGRLHFPTAVEGLTVCHVDNEAFESHLQTLALYRGWKVRSWVREQTSVPVFYAYERRWCRLTPDGRRVAISQRRAARMMRSVYGQEWDEWGLAA